MHKVYSNSQENFAFQCVCIYKGLYTNICLQYYLKGPVGMNTEYSSRTAKENRAGRGKKY